MCFCLKFTVSYFSELHQGSLKEKKTFFVDNLWLHFIV